jgi:hypothetical protein
MDRWDRSRMVNPNKPEGNYISQMFLLLITATLLFQSSEIDQFPDYVKIYCTLWLRIFIIITLFINIPVN